MKHHGGLIRPLDCQKLKKELFLERKEREEKYKIIYSYKFRFSKDKKVHEISWDNKKTNVEN